MLLFWVLTVIEASCLNSQITIGVDCSLDGVYVRVEVADDMCSTSGINIFASPDPSIGQSFGDHCQLVHNNATNFFTDTSECVEYNSAGNMVTVIHFETTLENGQILEIQSPSNITCYQNSFIVKQVYSPSESVQSIEQSALANNATMAIYDVNMTTVDSLIIGDLVTVVIDSGESIDRELRIKQCSVLGEDLSLKIIDEFQVKPMFTGLVSLDNQTQIDGLNTYVSFSLKVFQNNEIQVTLECEVTFATIAHQDADDTEDGSGDGGSGEANSAESSGSGGASGDGETIIMESHL